MWTALEWAAFGSVVTAFATILLTAATGGLIWAVIHQIGRARDEAKLARTLAICERYDTDKVLHDACVNIRSGIASGLATTNPDRYKTDITTLLNYFEQIALGIDSEVYDEDLAKRFIGTLATDHMDELIQLNLFERENFNVIAERVEKWRETPTA